MSRRGLFDVRHPWFNPLWVRILITGLLLVWALFEYSNGNMFWSFLFGAAGLYCLHQFFIDFRPTDRGDDQ